jgi:hypothetical protein
MTIRLLAVVAIVLLGIPVADPLPLPGLPPGPHAVGFRHQVLHDSSRGYRVSSEAPWEAAGRPIELSLWYPATPSAGARMTVGDYARLGDPRETAVPVMSASLSAVRDAAPSGRWPLVLFPHTGPAAESVMAEFLASYGFVVAGLPSRDSETGPYRLSVANLDAIGLDLNLVTKRLRAGGGAVHVNDVLIDERPPAILGMSNGALGAIAFELQSGPVTAIVSLDGTIGERVAGQAVPKLMRSAGAKMIAPLLHFYAPANDYLDFTELRAQARPFCRLAELPGMAHSDFLADAMFRAAATPGNDRALSNARTFAWINRRTLEFLLERFGRGALPATVAAADARAESAARFVPCNP